jgi:hypothetical protein
LHSCNGGRISQTEWRDLMKKMVTLTVPIKIDDKEDCYCDQNCKWHNHAWCELFEQTLDLDTHRLDFSLYGNTSRWKYFRCADCMKVCEEELKRKIGHDIFNRLLP